MSQDRWQRLEELYHRCLSCREEQRSEILDRELASDPDLRAELLEMLAASAADDSFLEPPTRPPQPPAAPEAAEEEEEPFHTDSRLGPYRVLRVLASGGMGTVLLAERSDAGFSHRVAVKVMKAARLGPELRERFRREREILSRLRHPNIARLFDGGTTDDGVEYIVMEYVDGQAVDEYCDHRTLDLRARVRLFLEICRAVHVAHRHLVVHRDLKPSNVLVDGDGTPKLLDFGIAKDLEQGRSALTRTSQRAMTPEFASPEQIRGEPITTASDVYSLGVLLHHLLAGGSPYRTTSSYLHELERAICEDDPARPSDFVARHPAALAIAERRSTRPDRLRRALRGDLDAIVMKALRKEVTARYPSAEAFADDLEHWLENRPILASPPSTLERLRKFVRRNPVGSALFATCLLIAAVAATLGWRYWVDVRDARNDAVREANRYRSSRDVLADLLTGADPWSAEGEVLDRSVLERVAAQLEAESGLDPEVEIALRLLLARTLNNRDEPARALPHLERALALQSEHPGPDAAERSCVICLEASRAAQGLDDSDAAARWMARSREYFATVAAPPADLPFRVELRGVMVDRNRLDLAENEAKVRDLLHRVEATDSLSTGFRCSLWNDLGTLLVDAYRLEEAEQMFRRVLEAMRGSRPTHPRRALAEANLSEVLRLEGRPQEAAELARQSLEKRRTVFGSPSMPVMNGLTLLGLAETDANRLDDAVPHLEEALEMATGLCAKHSMRVGSVQNNLARALRRRGDLARAAELYRDSLAILEEQTEEHPVEVATTQNNLGNLLGELGRLAEAEQLLQNSLDFRLEHFGEDHAETAFSLHNLGILAWRGKDDEKALEYFERALEARRAAFDPGHPAIVESLWWVGRTAAGGKDWSTAVEVLEECQELLESTDPVPLDWLAALATLLADCLREEGEDEKAVRVLREVLTRTVEGAGANAPSAASLRAALEKHGGG